MSFQSEVEGVPQSVDATAESVNEELLGSLHACDADEHSFEIADCVQKPREGFTQQLQIAIFTFSTNFFRTSRTADELRAAITN